MLPGKKARGPDCRAVELLPEGIDVTEMEARIDVSHRADRDDARPHKLTFHVAAAMLRERIKKIPRRRTCDLSFL